MIVGEILRVLIIFLLFWIGGVFAISRFGGWNKLADKYRAKITFHGKLWHYQSGWTKIGFAYRYSLLVGVNQDGLYIRPVLIFRWCHPPLFIPWEELITEDRGISIFKITRLKFKSCPGVYLGFNRRVFDRISAYLKEKQTEKPNHSLKLTGRASADPER